jgi:hypothetical protein
VDATISEHPHYTALGNTGSTRCAAYRALFATPLPPDVVAEVRAAQCARPRMDATRYRQTIAAGIRHRADIAPRVDGGDVRWPMSP